MVGEAYFCSCNLGQEASSILSSPHNGGPNISTSLDDFALVDISDIMAMWALELFEFDLAFCLRPSIKV